MPPSPCFVVSLFSRIHSIQSRKDFLQRETMFRVLRAFFAHFSKNLSQLFDGKPKETSKSTINNYSLSYKNMISEK